jgi:hypothetical protein
MLAFTVKRMNPTSRLFLAILTLSATSLVAQPTLTDDDRTAIQSLMAKYSQALGGCRATEFADLFLPDTGVFASGFRGRMVGRARLIALVESERQCTAPANTKAAAPRPGGNNGPTAVLTIDATGVHGVANVGTAEYQDDYAKTAQGWRFASRTVVTNAEKAAGLDAPDIVAIERLAAASGADNAPLGDHYEPDASGTQRLMTSGVRLSVTAGQVTGRAYRKDGTFVEQVYERLAPGQWRIKSR